VSPAFSATTYGDARGEEEELASGTSTGMLDGVRLLCIQQRAWYVQMHMG